jgi:hypothetical protein
LIVWGRRRHGGGQGPGFAEGRFARPGVAASPGRRRFRRGPWLAGAAVLASLLLAGCWDAQDPKVFDVVEAVGIQQAVGGPGVEAVAQVPTSAFLTGLLPAAGVAGSGGPQDFVVKGSGQSLPLALNAMDDVAGKVTYFGQVRVVFFDSALARAGLGDLVDQLQQLSVVPDGTPLAIADGPLMPMLTANLAGTGMAGRFVDLYFRTPGTRIVANVPLWSFFVDEHTPGLAASLPVFRLVSGGGSQLTLDAEGTAIFAGDRMASILTGPDNLGLQFWRNTVAQQTLAVSTPVGPVTVDDVGALTTYTVSGAQAGTPVLRATVRVTGTLRIGPAFLRPQDMQLVEDATSRQVEADMTTAFRSLQQAGTDVIGAGAWLHYHDPQAFARLQPWPRAFARLGLDLHVTTHLGATGWGS